MIELIRTNTCTLKKEKKSAHKQKANHTNNTSAPFRQIASLQSSISLCLSHCAHSAYAWLIGTEKDPVYLVFVKRSLDVPRFVYTHVEMYEDGFKRVTALWYLK